MTSGKTRINPLHLLLSCVDPDYRAEHEIPMAALVGERDTVQGAFQLAKENGLVHPFCTGLLDIGQSSRALNSLISREEEQLTKLSHTVRHVMNLLSDTYVPFAFIKLHRGLTYVPRDVDVYVARADGQLAVNALRKDGFLVKTFHGVETSCLKQGLLKVDLYQGVQYLGLAFFDDKFIVEDCRVAEVLDVRYPIPSRAADLLTITLHSLFGNRAISLLDLLYAKSFFEDAEAIAGAAAQAHKYGWQELFSKSFDLYRQIKKILFEQDARGLSFPYLLDPKFVWAASENLNRLSERTKMAFLLSVLMDYVVFKYQALNRVAPVDLPNSMKDILMRILHKSREWTGDQKASRD